MMTEAVLALPVFDRPVKLLIVSAVGEGAAGRVAIAMAERMAEYDGYVALSDTSDLSQEAWRSIGLLGLQGVCIGNGIGLEAGQAAFAALHLVAISRKWAGQTKGIGFRA
jgi:6,7-dimethyl-8-ribityllumazine synthase